LVPPRIVDEAEAPRYELQSQHTNPGDMKNSESLNEAPKEGEHKTGDECESQSSEVGPALTLVSNFEEAKQGPDSKS